MKKHCRTSPKGPSSLSPCARTVSAETSPPDTDEICLLGSQLRMWLPSQPEENRMRVACSHDPSRLLLGVLGCSLRHAPTLASVAEPLGMQSLEPGGFRAQPLYLGKVGNLLGPCPPWSSFPLMLRQGIHYQGWPRHKQ